MAVRKDFGNRVVITAGKTYTLKDSVKDIAGMESEGMERLMADCMAEALGELQEGERVQVLDSGFVTKNMTTHFWVVLYAEKGNEEGEKSNPAIATDSESCS